MARWYGRTTLAAPNTTTLPSPGAPPAVLVQPLHRVEALLGDGADAQRHRGRGRDLNREEEEKEEWRRIRMARGKRRNRRD